jgi:hypothetical protein
MNAGNSPLQRNIYTLYKLNQMNVNWLETCEKLTWVQIKVEIELQKAVADRTQRGILR